MKLTRFAYLPGGTLGRLELPEQVIYTLERPWQDNKPYVSCIPEGEYELEWDTTGRIKNVPRLRGTHPRTQINIHVANVPGQLQGCIAPGMDWSVDGHAPKVVQSRNAMSALLKCFEDAPEDQETLFEKAGGPAVLQITGIQANTPR